MKTPISRELEDWFKENKRDFPWRKNRSVYGVVVSEFMLQQTKASVVIAYYNRWMNRFPSFEVLAKSTESEVMKMWEGLGYYSRARNLRLIAKEIMETYNGEFPDILEKILLLKGIGPYTSSAISHFAFNKRALGADGNIKKVIARVYGHKEISSNGKQVLMSLDDFLPETNGKDVFEGLIELGATICSKIPKCQSCPLNHACKAHEEGTTHLIPMTKKREKITPVYRAVFLLEIAGKIAVIRQKEGLMKGLYEFPYIAIDKNEQQSDVRGKAEKEFSSKIESLDFFCDQSHVFTKYKAYLLVYFCKLNNESNVMDKYDFIMKNELESLAFSSGHKRVLKKFITMSLAR